MGLEKIVLTTTISMTMGCIIVAGEDSEASADISDPTDFPNNSTGVAPDPTATDSEGADNTGENGDNCGIQPTSFASLANSPAWNLVSDELAFSLPGDVPSLPSVDDFALVPELNPDLLRAMAVHNYSAVSPDLYELIGETPVPPVEETDPSMPPTSRLVFEPDERTLVSNPEEWPWRAIVALVAEIPGVGETNVCSGVLVGPRHVLTAAHCLYDTLSNVEYTLVGVAPGMDGENNYPNGLLAIEDMLVPEGYRLASTYADGIPYDFGLIVLQEYNSCLGWFGMDPLDDTTSIDNAQYPGADFPCPPDPATISCGGFMYHQSCMFDLPKESTWANYTCSTQRGASGSSLYNPNTLQALGIVSGENNALSTNYGVRLNEVYFQEICYWISLFPTEEESHECYF